MTRTEDAAGLIPGSFLASLQRLGAAAGAVGGPSGEQWADHLPRLLAETLDAWGLGPAGVTRAGCAAVVVPVVRGDECLALKMVWPHIEARDEALALRHWDGNGAVRLVRADPGRSVLLLERLDATRDLLAVDIDAACEVVGGLLGRLHVPAPPGLRSLSAFARDEATRMSPTSGGLPRRMVERTRSLVAALSDDPACDATLVHADLHYENVLAAAREPWLAIDPHAMAGHPGFEIQPLLRNRRDELGTGSQFRGRVRRRLEIACEAGGIDQDQALAWTYVHTAIQARWAAADHDADGVTFCIALLKALDG